MLANLYLGMAEGTGSALCVPAGRATHTVCLWGRPGRQGPWHSFQTGSVGRGRHKGGGYVTKPTPVSPSVTFSQGQTHFATPAPHLLEGFSGFGLCLRYGEAGLRLSASPPMAEVTDPCPCDLLRKAELDLRKTGLAGAVHWGN